MNLPGFERQNPIAGGSVCEDFDSWKLNAAECFGSDCPLFNLLWTVNGKSETKPPAALLELLDLSANMEASVPQDRVFTLLALTREEERFQIHVDYGEPLTYLATIGRNALILGGTLLASRLVIGENLMGSRLSVLDGPAGLLGRPKYRNGYNTALSLWPMVSKLLQAYNKLSAFGEFFSQISPDSFVVPAVLSLPCYIVGTAVACRASFRRPEDEPLISNFFRQVNESQVTVSAEYSRDLGQELRAWFAVKDAMQFITGSPWPNSDANPGDSISGYSLWRLLICYFEIFNTRRDDDCFDNYRRYLIWQWILLIIGNPNRDVEEWAGALIAAKDFYIWS